MVKPADRRSAASWLMRKHSLSQRRSCGLMMLQRSSYRYESTVVENEELKNAAIEEAQKRPRFGYRRLQIMHEYVQFVCLVGLVCNVSTIRLKPRIALIPGFLYDGRDAAVTCEAHGRAVTHGLESDGVCAKPVRR